MNSLDTLASHWDAFVKYADVLEGDALSPTDFLNSEDLIEFVGLQTILNKDASHWEALYEYSVLLLGQGIHTYPIALYRNLHKPLLNIGVAQ